MKKRQEKMPRKPFNFVEPEEGVEKLIQFAILLIKPDLEIPQIVDYCNELWIISEEAREREDEEFEFISKWAMNAMLVKLNLQGFKTIEKRLKPSMERVNVLQKSLENRFKTDSSSRKNSELTAQRYSVLPPIYKSERSSSFQRSQDDEYQILQKEYLQVIIKYEELKKNSQQETILLTEEIVKLRMELLSYKKEVYLCSCQLKLSKEAADGETSQKIIDQNLKIDKLRKILKAELSLNENNSSAKKSIERRKSL